MDPVLTMRSLLQHLGQQMQASELAELVENAIQYHTHYTGHGPHTNTLSAQLRHTVRHEREGDATPLRDFPDLIDRAAGAPLDACLTTVAQNYLHRTAYLRPFLHSFGHMSIRLMRAFGHTTLANFLRDGLIFWPTQEVLMASEARRALAFIWYSRQHADANVPPQVFRRHITGEFDTGALDVPHSLLIDVGLYGTLLRHLLDQQRCAAAGSVLFFASRSPFIAGWLNLHTCAALLTAEGRVDGVDSIRLVDTLESLLKPCTLVANQLTLTDPVSFICATAFLWAQRRFAQAHQQDPTASCDMHLESVKRSRTAWFVTNPAPCWEDAEAFIKSWNHGPLSPMDRLCGLHI